MKGVVFVTRPLADCGPFLDVVRVAGLVPFAEPLLTVRFLASVPKPPPDMYDGLVFTSANGVRAFAALSLDRGRPVYAVGDATAQAAQEAGFRTVLSAAGNAEDLVNLVAREARAGFRLLYPRGRDVSRPLADMLSSQGVRMEETIVYEAVAATAFSPEGLDILKAGPDAVTFFSARTGAVFVGLARKSGCESCLRETKALCLSESVLESVRLLPWGGTYSAARPDLQGMTDLVRGPGVFRRGLRT